MYLNKSVLLPHHKPSILVSMSLHDVFRNTVSLLSKNKSNRPTVRDIRNMWNRLDASKYSDQHERRTHIYLHSTVVLRKPHMALLMEADGQNLDQVLLVSAERWTAVILYVPRQIMRDNIWLHCHEVVVVVKADELGIFHLPSSHTELCLLVMRKNISEPEIKNKLLITLFK